MLRESLRLYGQAQPANDLKIARAGSQLGGCLTGLGRFEEAQEHLLESLARIHEGGVRHPVLFRETLIRIVDLYNAWGLPDKAAPYLDMENQL